MSAEVVSIEKPVPEFKPGTIVRLKCGGCDMAVRWTVDVRAATATGASIGVSCDWHDEVGQPCSETYSPDQLMLSPR